MIARNFDSGVSLLFQTQFFYLVDKYKKDYVIEKEAQQVFENIPLGNAQLRDIKNLLYIFIFVSLYLSSKKNCEKYEEIVKNAYKTQRKKNSNSNE